MRLVHRPAGSRGSEGACRLDPTPATSSPRRYRLDRPARRERGRPLLARPRPVLDRHVAVHLIPARRPARRGLLDAARDVARPSSTPGSCASSTPTSVDDLCFVVNEWGQGTSLDLLLATTARCSRAAPPGSSPRWPTRRPGARRRAGARSAGPRERAGRPPRTGQDHRLRGRRRAARPAARAPVGRPRRPRRPAVRRPHRQVGRASPPRSSPPRPPTTAPCCVRGRSGPASRGRSTPSATRSSTPAGPPTPASSAAVIADDAARLRRRRRPACGESAQDHATMPPWAPPAGPGARPASERPRPAAAARPRAEPAPPTRPARCRASPSPPGRGTGSPRHRHRPSRRDPSTGTDLPDEPVGDAEEPSRTGPVDQPTQAGMPVFDDERDEIGWVARPQRPAAPAAALRGAARQAALRPRAARGPARAAAPRGVRRRHRRAATGRWEATSGGQHTGSHAGQRPAPASLVAATTRAPATTPSPAAAGSGSPLLIGLCLLVALAALAGVPDRSRQRRGVDHRVPRLAGDHRAPDALPGGDRSRLRPAGHRRPGGELRPGAAGARRQHRHLVEHVELQPAARPGRAQDRRRAWSSTSAAPAASRQVDVATLGGPTSLAVYITGAVARRRRRPHPGRRRPRAAAPSTVELDEAGPGRLRHGVADRAPAARRHLPRHHRRGRGRPGDLGSGRPVGRRAAGRARGRRRRRLRHPLRPAPRPALGGRAAHHGQPRGRRRRPPGRA